MHGVGPQSISVINFFVIFLTFRLLEVGHFLHVIIVLILKLFWKIFLCFFVIDEVHGLRIHCQKHCLCYFHFLFHFCLLFSSPG